MPRSSARLNAKASGSGSNAAAASSSAQPLDDSLINPELDKLLNVKRRKIKGYNPSHTPRFPAFHELQRTDMLLSEGEVKAYRNSLSGPPIPDGLEQLSGPKFFPLCEDVYHAITETRYARVSDGSRLVDKNRTTGDYYYGPKYILALSATLIVRLLGGSSRGFRESNDDAQKSSLKNISFSEEELQMKYDAQQPSLEDITFAERHRELCLVLLFEKSIVEEILRGDGQKITNLIAGPASYALSKPGVRNSWVAGILEASRAAGNAPNPVLPPPRHNASIPAYPTFDEALRTLPDQTQMWTWGPRYLHSLNTRFPRTPEGRLDWLKRNKRYLVIKLYDAICSVSDIRSREDGINGAHFIDYGKPLYSPRISPKTIQEACWRIATVFLEGVELGFFKPKMPNYRDERPIPPSSKDLPWNKRFALMLETLRQRKAVCWRLVKGNRGEECFIANPYAFRNLGICDADQAAAAIHPEDMEMINFNTILMEEGIIQ